MSNILVLDPVPTRRRVVVDLLNAVGWKVFEAEQPWEALALLKVTPIRLLIVNAGAQNAAGLALVHHLRTRAETRHIPALQLGYGVTGDPTHEAHRAGVNHRLDYDVGVADLVLGIALLMGQDPATRAVLAGMAQPAISLQVTSIWQAQIELLDGPSLTPGGSYAAREVLERLLSVREDDLGADAALALTGVPHAGALLRSWAGQYLPQPAMRLDPGFERLMGRCLGHALHH
jgi:CheY-like chemotaxis protein